jgi:predicted DsbA family dithiol-disulfide isomerase
MICGRGISMIKVEVWSDINCPYCYIGKRNLEKALEKFPRAESVEIEWRSFELDPFSNLEKGSDQIDLIAWKYGKDRAWVENMNRKISDMGKEIGLEFHLGKVVPSNSFKAHKLLHLAKFYGIQNELQEALFRAKFSEGKDINDIETLIALGQKENLDPVEIKEVLEGKRYDQDVRKDEETGSGLGIRGVPFFVINKTEALSGAQPPEAFLEVLESMN